MAHLKGKVSIGPLVPVVREGEEAPTPAPEVYSAREIVVYKKNGVTEYTRLGIDSTGRYQAELPVGIILSWRIFDHLSAEGTRQILIEASQHLSPFIRDIILVDGGSENRIEKYGDTLSWAKDRMQRALVDIAYSNSIIEAFWRKMKCSFLFKYNLDSLATVKRLVAKFIEEYNTLMPHSAFKGQTPDEMFFGNASHLEEELVRERMEAREKRIEFNRALSCDACNIDSNYLYSSTERREGIELQN